MILLVSGSTKSVARHAPSAAGCLGVLLTPANGNRIEGIVESGLPWACDNAAFANFDAAAFARMACRVVGKGPLWVACPDVVCDAPATRAKFDHWGPWLSGFGLPVAFVGQDGCEDLPLPWDRFVCFFIGGSTEWKLSQAAADLAAEAKARGKLVHMGRVNSLERIAAAQLRQVDSIDGTACSMYGEAHIPKFLRHLAHLDRQPILTGLSLQPPCVGTKPAAHTAPSPCTSPCPLGKTA